MGLHLTLISAAIWRLLRPAKQTVVVQQPSSPMSVADELFKLQRLLEQGVLTAAEFEEQKRRLLR
ncbi:SHOCT domain-containing protein [uncultured Hymenobacter sp.]|uniref:SHOCT domain-containing protein n=1 Tax=uncultured Hymenobacter sp. TaxID=170016 RepID=UPI0035C96A58